MLSVILILLFKQDVLNFCFYIQRRSQFVVYFRFFRHFPYDQRRMYNTAVRFNGMCIPIMKSVSPIIVTMISIQNNNLFSLTTQKSYRMYHQSFDIPLSISHRNYGFLLLLRLYKKYEKQNSR